MSRNRRKDPEISEDEEEEEELNQEIEESDEDQDDEDDDGFEKQSSSDEGEPDSNEDEESEIEEENNENLLTIESNPRKWTPTVGRERSKAIEAEKKSGLLSLQEYLHNDDLSSDDEAAEGNTIGRVPLHWYDAFDHIGYNIEGSKVEKRKGKDRIDLALSQKDDPEAKRTIYDMYNDREIVLTERELEIIRRVQAGAFAHPEFDDTPDYVDFYSGEKEEMPVYGGLEPKRRFLPSKWEMMKVMKIVKAIKEGKYKEGKEEEKGKKPPVYLIWNDAEDDIIAESKRFKFHLPAPKVPLPGHAESYNPPTEYLLTDEEKQKYEDMDPKDRPMNFTPKAHSCLRHVAGYQNFVKERFERCLDLYLCPRKLKQRLNIDPESLIPRLPKPKELKPFPNTLNLQFLGHSAAVRSLSISPDGQYLASGSDDGTVCLWEIDTGLCRFSWDLENGPVISVLFNPNPEQHFLVAVSGKKVVFITTGTGDKDSTESTDVQLSGLNDVVMGIDSGNNEPVDETEQEVDEDEIENETENKKKSNNLSWNFCKGYKKILQQREKGVLFQKSGFYKEKYGSIIGPRVELLFPEIISSIAWHHKGDYLAILSPSMGSKAVSIHQISKGKTQFPFTKSPGKIQKILFHPIRPFLFVVTQQHIKVYHLVEQKLMKKLLSGCKWLSSGDIHPSGDHIIVGSYDRRVVWFDLDLASTPYKTLKFHEKAVRDVQFHKRYPLFASASDDGNIHIFHSMVYSDLTRNPLIVPLKVLRGHGVVGGTGVFSCIFHPRQPWVFTAGADGVICLFVDV